MPPEGKVKLSFYIDRGLRDLAVDARDRDETFTALLATAVAAEVAKRRGLTVEQVMKEAERIGREDESSTALPRGRRPEKKK